MAESHIRDDLAAFALGILEPAETRRIEQHLAGCPECAAELADLSRAADELAWLAAEATPDPGLRDAILAGVRSGAAAGPRRIERWAWLRPIVAAAAAVLLFALGFATAALLPRVAPAQPETEIAAVFNPARVQVAVLEPTDYAPRATARAYFEPQRKEIVLAVDQLPAPPPGQTYQLWATAGERRWSAGTFGGQQTVYRFVCPREMSAYDGLGVTLEPSGGRTEPSGPRVLAGPIR